MPRTIPPGEIPIPPAYGQDELVSPLAQPDALKLVSDLLPPMS
jgi:hypothetical protein